MSERATTQMPVIDANEQEHAATIGRRIEQSRQIRRAFESCLARRVSPFSELGIDDSATAWMQSSHVVVGALTMANDNLRALDAMLLLDNQLTFPMYAHYPIIRSILEASAEAVWLLESDDRTIRIARLLRARFTDSKQDVELARVQFETVASLDEPPDEAKVEEARAATSKRYARDMSKLRELANARSIPWAEVKKGLPPWIHLIRAVCAVEATAESPRVPGGYAAGLWKIVSGLSHPSMSRSLNHGVVEPIEAESTDGIIFARVSASLRLTSEALTVAVSTTHDAVALLAKRTKLG